MIYIIFFISILNSVSPPSFFLSQLNKEKLIKKALTMPKGESFFEKYQNFPPTFLPHIIKEKIKESANFFSQKISLPRKEKKILIIGGGPIGMLSALLYRSLGYQITIIEKRASFERIQKIVIDSDNIKNIENQIFILENESFFEFLTHLGIIKKGLRSINSFSFSLPIQLIESILHEFILQFNKKVSSPNKIAYHKGYEYIDSWINSETDHLKVLVLNKASHKKLILNSHIVLGCDGAHSLIRETAQQKLNLYLRKSIHYRPLYIYYVYIKNNNNEIQMFRINGNDFELSSEKEIQDFHKKAWEQIQSEWDKKNKILAVSFYNNPEVTLYIQNNQEKNNTPLFLLGDSLCHGFIGHSFNSTIRTLFDTKENVKQLLKLDNKVIRLQDGFHNLRREFENSIHKHISSKDLIFLGEIDIDKKSLLNKPLTNETQNTHKNQLYTYV